MNKLITYKNLVHYFFISIITFLIWASIGSKYIILENTNELNFKLIINNLRFFLPLILIIILIYFKQNYQKNYYLKIIIFTIFISFTIGNYNLHNNVGLVQIFNNDQILIKFGYVPNYFRDIMMGVFFISTYLIFSRLDQPETETLLKLNFILLISTTFITLYFAYSEFFSSQNNKEYLYYTQFLITGELFGVPTIRSLGLSRNLLIILIPLTFFSLLGKNKKNNIYLNIIIIFLCISIFQLQSRLTIYSFFIFSILILGYLIFKKDLKKIIFFIFIFLIIPQFLNLLVVNAKINYFKEKPTTNIIKFIQELKIPKSRMLTSTPNNKNFKIEEIRKNYNVNLVSEDAYLASEYTSGRTELWKKTLKIFTEKNDYKNIFFGFGTSADRYFLKENVSNSLFYSLISGGYLGLIFLILFYLYLLNTIYFFLVNRKKNEDNIIIYSAITVILFIMLRSLVENSFLIYGTDNIILFTSLFYLENKKIV